VCICCDGETHVGMNFCRVCCDVGTFRMLLPLFKCFEEISDGHNGSQTVTIFKELFSGTCLLPCTLPVHCSTSYLKLPNHDIGVGLAFALGLTVQSAPLHRPARIKSSCGDRRRGKLRASHERCHGSKFLRFIEVEA
jgi:hypothetical protein